MERRLRRAALAEVDRSCRTATDATALHRAVAAALAPAVPFDRWCAITFDPATALPTGGFHAEGLPMALMPRLLQLEFGTETDIGRLSDLARAVRPVTVLSEATGRHPSRSARFRDVLCPAGLPHEVRAVHRDGRSPWGATILLRGGDVPDFGPDEAALLSAVTPRVAAALRRVHLLSRPRAPGEDDAPGVLLLALTGAAVTVASGTPSALRRIREIEDGDLGGVPVAVASLARTAHHRPGAARCRVRTRSGRWLTLHAERLSVTTVSLVVEPARPTEVAALLSDAYGLTAREAEMVALVVRGHTNAEIARALWLSPYTVADHVKTVFAKTGVRSRGELTSRLFFDHDLPRS